MPYKLLAYTADTLTSGLVCFLAGQGWLDILGLPQLSHNGQLWKQRKSVAREVLTGILIKSAREKNTLTKKKARTSLFPPFPRPATTSATGSASDTPESLRMP